MVVVESLSLLTFLLFDSYDYVTGTLDFMKKVPKRNAVQEENEMELSMDDEQ